MLHILIFLSSLAIISADDGWLVPAKSSKIDFDLEATPLEIKTDSAVGTSDMVIVNFHSADGLSYSGGVSIKFTSPPTVAIVACDKNGIYKAFPAADLNLAFDNTNVWRVTVTRTSGISLTIYCNDKEVLDYKFSDSKCVESAWNSIWSKNKKKISFGSMDKATDFYRAWTEPPKCEAPTIGDGKVSPSTAISPGSSYTVICNGGFTLKGNKDISCTEKTGKATLSNSPTCEKDAKDDDKTKLSFANCLKVNAALLVVLISAALLI
jgi:hypothetical protein